MSQLIPGLRRAFYLSLAMLLANATHAADVACDVGAQVEGDEIAGGETGEIVEIGTARPHVGWYRIKFSFNPGGDWFDPRTVPIKPSGSSDRCVVKKAAAAVPEQPAPQEQTPAEPAAAPDFGAAGLAIDTNSSARCPAGRQVVDRQQQTGKVIGESNGLCVVNLDAGGSRSYLHWMLTDAGGEKATSGLPAGAYTCSAGAAGGSFGIGLDEGGSYVDRAGASGRYAVDAASGRIQFSSGSLKGQHSKVLGPGKFGLSSSSSNFFSTVCNLKS